ncbi:MAG: hypothetical protein LUM44_06995 [Pyrinomonadaceae bacterium]|nr:hypothetical protein [Pyrinomonadaceae bacterium]
MEENRLLTPAKRKEIENFIILNNLNLSDFAWENHKSEDFKERVKLFPKSRIANKHSMELRYSYQIKYENTTQKVSKLTYQTTLAFITFDRFDKKWMSKFSFGVDYGIETKIFNSLEDQINFAKNEWLITLIQNLLAEGLISSPIEEIVVLDSASNKVLDDNIDKATLLYNEIVGKYPLSNEFIKVRENETLLLEDIEKINDAVKLFGTEFPDKRAKLNQLKEEITLKLPTTPDEWSKNFWRNTSRKISNYTGIKTGKIIGFIVLIFAVIVIFAFVANLLKVKDSIYNEQNFSGNKDMQNSKIAVNHTSLQSSNMPILDSKNNNLSEKKEQEEIIIKEGESKKVIEKKVIISLIGISFEKTSSGSLGYKITGEIAEVGKKSLKFVRKEIGYSTKLTVNGETYENRIISANINEVTFLITKLETKTKK